MDFKNSSSFFRQKKIKFLEEDNLPFGFFSFPPSHTCNLRCRYCFAGAGKNYSDNKKEIQKEDITQICKFMINEFLPNSNYFRLDFVSGGEPLLKRDLVYDSIVQTKDIFEKSGKKLFIWLCTNGTCDDFNIVEKLSDLGVHFGVSIDGEQNIHDKMRVYKDGSGTYTDVVQFIKKIQDSPKISRISKQLWGLSVITAQTESLVRIIKHHKNIGFKTIQMKLARLDKDNEISINEKNLDKILFMINEFFEYLYQSISMDLFEDVVMIANDNDFIGKFVLRIINQTPISIRCYAGRAKVSIAANGDVYPCDSFVGNDKFCLGSIWEGIDQNKRKQFYLQNVDNRKACRSCWIKYLCGGDCYYNSYISNNTIDEPDSIICKINKHIVKEILITLYRIQNENPNRYNTLKRILKMRSNI